MAKHLTGGIVGPATPVVSEPEPEPEDDLEQLTEQQAASLLAAELSDLEDLLDG
jgi:hypothetical protein